MTGAIWSAWHQLSRRSDNTSADFKRTAKASCNRWNDPPGLLTLPVPTHPSTALTHNGQGIGWPAAQPEDGSETQNRCSGNTALAYQGRWAAALVLYMFSPLSQLPDRVPWETDSEHPLFGPNTKQPPRPASHTDLRLHK